MTELASSETLNDAHPPAGGEPALPRAWSGWPVGRS